MDINKIEACLIYFPRAQYLISLQNEDKKLIDKIFNLIKDNPKVIDLSIYKLIKLIDLNKENENEH